MPYVASIGTYLPCWGTPLQRVAGDDDTRRVYLVLTPLGERLRSQALAEIAKTDKHLSEKIGSWELDRLEKLLSKIQQEKGS